MNPFTNKAEIASLAIVSGKMEKHSDFVLWCFRDSVHFSGIPIFLVDKDFTCINSVNHCNHTFNTQMYALGMLLDVGDMTINMGRKIRSIDVTLSMVLNQDL